MSHKIPESSSSSFEEVLPWDLVADEILPRLPLKSLAKFKCVSKLLNSHISSPNFARNLSPVFQCASSTERRFIYFRLRGTQFTKLEHAPRTASYLWPVGSSNGITCFVIVSTYNHEYRSKCITILWNPSIHEHPLEIRPPPLGPESMVQPEFCAAIGHDPRTGDYKVVLVNYGRGEPLAHVYALKSQRWKQIDIDENVDAKLRCDRVKIDRRPQCSAHGTRVHWLANCRDDRDSTGKRYRRMLVSFDMCDEAFGLVNLPECLAINAHVEVELASMVRNNLVQLFEYDDIFSSRKDIYFLWVMTEYGVQDSWTKLKISLGELGKPLGYWNKDKLLFLLIDCKRLLSYDIKTKEREYLQIPNTSILSCVGDYVDSQVKFSYPRFNRFLHNPNN